MKNITNKIATGATIGLMIAMSAVIPALAATSASLTLKSPVAATFAVGQAQTVRWTSKNYSSPTVTVNLIRKVSDNPSTYELVRTIAANTKNDGVATWVPLASDAGTALSLEIACAPSAKACTAGDSLSSGLAVIDNGGNSNTAAIYQAIEQWYNR